MQLNEEDFDAVIFAGDLTTDGSIQKWTVNDFLAQINSTVLFVPGNHDLMSESARANWLKHIGYLSKEISIKGCNFILLNSTNSGAVDFQWDKIVSGNGLDRSSIEILNSLSPTR